MPAKELLYGEDLVPPGRQSVCAVEGHFDAMRIGPGAVGLSGTAYTEAQVARLARYAVVGICFDREPEAQRRARRLAGELSAVCQEVHILQLEHAKDPGSAGAAEVAAIRRALAL
jgi:DNA primase